jgi:hypothetical protein
LFRNAVLIDDGRGRNRFGNKTGPAAVWTFETDEEAFRWIGAKAAGLIAGDF